VRSHEDRVRAQVTEILDELEAGGGGEVVEMVASRLPAMMICDLLGYPHELWPKVREWSEVTMFEAGQTSPEGGGAKTQSDASANAVLEFASETMKVIAERRAEPTDDLISVWAHTEVHGEPWTDGEILTEALLVLDGGAETTRAVIAGIIAELARRPEQRKLLVEQPELLGGSGVEEFIRWISPISNMRRTATRDVELHGQTIHEGDEVLLLYGAANRDDRVFTDPEGFDVTRPHNHHVAFGFGTHFCLGASLARLELRVLFEELLRRFPDYRLVGPEPEIVPATFTRGYREVHIEL
jgi:cytochrome P450 family 142 subfamily A polypeptide 1